MTCSEPGWAELEFKPKSVCLSPDPMVNYEVLNLEGNLEGT